MNIINEIHKMEEAFKKHIYYTYGLIFIAGLVLMLLLFLPKNCSHTIPYELDIQAKADLELADLDMRTNYTFLSSRCINEIKSSLIEGHRRFPYIPIILVYTIIRIESDCHYWWEHPIVTLQSGKNKGLTVRCVGLCGIQWEQWDSLLVQTGIAEQRSDLFQMKENILASYFIINEGIKIHKNDIHKYNILNIISVAYFGGGSWNGQTAENYKDKLVRYTSELFILKMTNDINKSYNYKEN
jgi:hypothetical protein